MYLAITLLSYIVAWRLDATFRKNTHFHENFIFFLRQRKLPRNRFHAEKEMYNFHDKLHDTDEEKKIHFISIRLRVCTITELQAFSDDFILEDFK